MHLNLHELQIKYLVVTPWAEISWLLRIFYDLFALGWLCSFWGSSWQGHTPSHPHPQYQIETHPPHLPPPPQSHLYQAVIDPFLFSPSWYLGLPIGTPHDAVSIRRRHTSASSNGPSLGTNFIVCTGGDSTCELKLFGNLNCNPCCYFYWTSTLP